MKLMRPLSYSIITSSTTTTGISSRLFSVAANTSTTSTSSQNQKQQFLPESLSAKLAAYDVHCDRATGVLHLTNTSHPRFAPIKITAQFINNMDDDDGIIDNEPFREDDGDFVNTDGMKKTTSDLNAADTPTPVMSMNICLKCGGHDVAIKCEGTIMSDEPASSSSSARANNNFEAVSSATDDHQPNGYDEGLEDDDFNDLDSFRPLTIAVSSDGRLPDLDDERTFCEYVEDMSADDQDKLEELLEKIGIDTDTTNEIGEMLVKAESVLDKEHRTKVVDILKSI